MYKERIPIDHVLFYGSDWRLASPAQGVHFKGGQGRRPPAETTKSVPERGAG
ncbi:hypothetical protein VNF293_28870 [Atlantibacter hermannii]